MTCLTCGYQASYEAPACPRCGAVTGTQPPELPSQVASGAEPSAGQVPQPASPADNATPRPAIGDELAASPRPAHAEQTVSRAALRADLARGSLAPTGFPDGGSPGAVVPGSPSLSGSSVAWPSAVPGVPVPSLGDSTFASPTFATPTYGVLNSSPTPATLGDRFLASVVDGLVMMAAMLPFSVILSVMDTRRGVGQIVSAVLSVVVMGVIVAYSPILIGRHGRTIGKNALRIEVQDVRTGRPVGVGAAFGRWLMLGLMGTPCYLGYLSILLDKSGYHRGWHDSTANSRVVKTTTQIPVSTLLRLRG